MMDMAKLKIKAMRRSTMKRQGSGINIKELMHSDLENLAKKENRVEEVEAELLSSSDSSENTVIDGEIVQKFKFKSGFQTKRSSLAENHYKLTDEEKLKLQKETQQHIKSIIKQAKISAKNSNMLYSTKNYKSDKTCLARKSKSIVESPRLKSRQYDLSRRRRQKTFFQSTKGEEKLNHFTNIKQSQEIIPVVNEFKTASNFFKPITPMANEKFNLNKMSSSKMPSLTTQNWLNH